jgi:hypothetical protein
MLFRRISKGRNCPECQSGEVFRVKRTGIALKFVCNVTNLRPHWCSTCDTFFLAPKRNKSVRVSEGFELSDGKATRNGADASEHRRLAN